MRTKQKIESENEANKRDTAIERFCEVIADYGLPTPIDFQERFDGANRADTSIPAHQDRSTGGGVFGGK
jgi:hypothetical protein